jgi:GcrA cell cycle regulator
MITNENVPLPTKGGDLVIPPNERKTLRTLKGNECRWPYGDPRQKDFHFCGKRKAAGKPYCEFHVRRAFQPARPREYRPHLPRAAA